MKIGVQTWGSHGDIRPFLALAEGLQLAGHDVTLLITCVDSDAYAGVTSPAGVRIRVLASPVMMPEEGAEIGWPSSIARSLKQMALIMRRCFAPAEDAMFAAAMRLAAESELLVGHYFTTPADHGRTCRQAVCERAAVACGDSERVQPSAWAGRASSMVPVVAHAHPAAPRWRHMSTACARSSAWRRYRM
jgi:predicted component of type VI protein secretion system